MSHFVTTSYSRLRLRADVSKHVVETLTHDLVWPRFSEVTSASAGVALLRGKNPQRLEGTAL